MIGSSCMPVFSLMCPLFFPMADVDIVHIDCLQDKISVYGKTRSSIHVYLSIESFK